MLQLVHWNVFNPGLCSYTGSEGWWVPFLILLYGMWDPFLYCVGTWWSVGFRGTVEDVPVSWVAEIWLSQDQHLQLKLLHLLLQTTHNLSPQFAFRICALLHQWACQVQLPRGCKTLLFGFSLCRCQGCLWWVIDSHCTTKRAFHDPVTWYVVDLDSLLCR